MNLNQQPFFSIIIPTYNRADLICKTLDSILKQKFTAYEIIIVDDGSTDDTEERIKSYLNDFTYYFKKSNEERGVARNFGTKKAQGKYLNWFDSDDIMLENHLETAYNFIQQKKQPEFFALGYEMKDAAKIYFKSEYDGLANASIYKGNCFACNPVFVRADIAQANLFHEDRRLAGSEDYELWLRLAAQYPFHTSKIITSQLIVHEQRSVISMRTVEKLENRFLLFLELCLSNPQVLNLLNKNKGYFVMKNLLILAVDLAATGNKKKAIKHTIQAMKQSLFFVFDKTFYAVLKHLILKKSALG